MHIAGISYVESVELYGVEYVYVVDHDWKGTDEAHFTSFRNLVSTTSASPAVGHYMTSSLGAVSTRLDRPQGASVGWKTGFEPATSGTTIQRSNQLSYNHRLDLTSRKMLRSPQR